MTETEQTPTETADDVQVEVADYTGGDQPDEAVAEGEAAPTEEETAATEDEATDDDDSIDAVTVDQDTAARHQAIGYPAGTETTKN